ncbi:MAG TPA: acyltransferase family protein, partial [Jatrophihabitans sp.]|nr:acyltransferase family protein [Jatrophihabitans sp.]
TAVSFEWAVHESGRSPVAAYFSSFDRAWELGVGACLAVLSAALNRLPAWLRPPIAYSGLAAIAVAAVTITSTTTFSPPWAAVAVGGAALVIMAGSGAQSYRYLWVLTNPLATWIGALSYSLYLWHYPVIIFAQALVARRDAAFYLGVCAVTVALSVVSYYVIEDPIRRSSLLAPRSHRPAHLLRTNTGRARRADRSARWRAGFVAAAVAIVAAVLTVSAAREGTSSRPIAFSDPASNSSSGSPGSTAPPPSELPPISGADIRRALTTPAWPAIDLSEDGIHRLQNPDLSTHCLANFTDTEGGRCDSGAAPGTTHAVLFGDSIALAWAATVRAAFPTWHVSSFAKSTCPWINALIDVPAVGPYSACLQWHRFVFRSLAELQPDVIFVSNAEHQLNALYPRPARALRDKTWSRDARTTIAHLERITHARIVYLAAPPGIEPIATCATKFNTPKDCIGTVSADWDRSIADIRRATARDPRVKVIDTSSWFCVARRCPPIFQGVPVRSDDVHMTALYGERIAPNFALALARATPALTR